MSIQLIALVISLSFNCLLILAIASLLDKKGSR